MSVIRGYAVIWGIQPLKPIDNIPGDVLKVRIRMRHDDFAQAFLKFHDRVERWIIGPQGNMFSSPSWVLITCLGVDHR